MSHLSRVLPLFFFALFGTLLTFNSAYAGQAANPPAATPTVAAPAVVTPPAVTPAAAQNRPAGPEAQILSVTVIDPKDCGTEFALGKDIVVTLDKIPPAFAPNKKLGLFLNKIFMKNLDPIPVPGEPMSLRFHLLRTKDNQDAWSQLFSRKSITTKRTQKCDCNEDEKVSVTVGLEDGSWAATNPRSLCLELLPNRMASFTLFFVSILIALGTVLLGWKSSLLRDSGDPRTDGKLGTYSLGRFQMAVWFVTVVFSFLLIYAATGDIPPVPPGTLILMGIGAGTAVGAASIDLNKRTASKQDLVNLTAEHQTLPQQIQNFQQKIAAAPAGDPNLLTMQKQLADAQQRLLVVNDQLTKIPSTQVAPTEGITEDLLSDANGISFHRLQVLGWTLVFLVVFLQSVFTKLTMVDFDTTQLALMGISGGTYVGFKLQEKQS